jgi:hypothetical protein
LVGPSRSQGLFALQVDATGVDTARIVVDGIELKEAVPTGEVISVEIADFADGLHQLRARAFIGEVARESAPVQVGMDRTPPTMTVSPPGGGTHALPNEPFVIDLEFDDQIDPASVGASILGPGRLPVTGVTSMLDADLRHLRIEAPPLSQLKTAELMLSVRNLAGLAPWGNYLVWWSYVPFAVNMVRPPAGTLPELSGTVELQATWWNPRKFLSMEAFVDGAPIGSMQYNRPLPWDSLSVPDGLHELTFLAHGKPAGSVSLLVMNRGPELLSCTARFATPPDAAVTDGFDITFDREVCFGTILDYNNWCTSSFGGVGQLEIDRRLAGADGFSKSWIWKPGSAGVGTYLLSFAEARGRSGRPPVGVAECSVNLPTWRAPWGDSLPAELAGSEFVLFDSDHPLQGGTTGVLLRIAPGGSPLPGAIEVWDSFAPNPLAPHGLALNGAPFQPASQVRSSGSAAVWLEAGLTGATQVRQMLRPWRLYYPSSLSYSPAETVTSLPAAAGPIELASSGVGWIQTGVTGARELRAAFLGYSWIVTSPANVDPLADASQAAVLRTGQVAFVETLAAAPGHLRVRRAISGSTPVPSLGWTSLGDILNRDPLVSAAEPSLGVASQSGGPPLTVAWTEGGQVLARTWSDVDGWSAAAALNADPLAAARSPHILPSQDSLRILFIERGVGGDRFELRQLDPVLRTWSSLAPLSAEGEVTWMSVASLMYVNMSRPHPVLAWKDLAGVVRLRVYNE